MPVAAAAIQKAIKAKGGGVVAANGQPKEEEGPSTPEDAGEPVELYFAKFWQYQKPVGKFYKHTYTEVFVAVLIGGNFLSNLVAGTIDPAGTKYEAIWYGLELFFNIAFSIELGFNMYAFWLWEFWSSSWNVFDFVVVSIGILTTINVPLPGPFKMLRMMRAFRVFRLFKRVKSLRQIMENLAKALPGVFNAFVILVLVMAIYAILGVEFWLDFGKGGVIQTQFDDNVPYMTSRQQEYGADYFGNFPKSLFTMFQVMTTESWCEAIARPLLMVPDTFTAVATAIYFVTFSILCGIILVNVAVTALLEKFCEKEEDGDVDFGEDQPDDLAAQVDTLKGDLGEVKGQLTRILKFIRDQEELKQTSSPPPVGICS